MVENTLHETINWTKSKILTSTFVICKQVKLEVFLSAEIVTTKGNSSAHFNADSNLSFKVICLQKAC